MVASLGVIFTLFIVVMLAAASFMFTKDANQYCIRPIENIMTIFQEFAENPLARIRVDDFDIDEREEDTSQLMKSIIKIGSLLQIGFGEAGANIIGQNLRAGGDVNPMLPGKKVHTYVLSCRVMVVAYALPQWLYLLP